MDKYNRHKNWNHWNVSLWINNDSYLYTLATVSVNTSCNLNAAVEQFIEVLAEDGITETPDGARYTKTAVRAAMVGL